MVATRAAVAAIFAAALALAGTALGAPNVPGNTKRVEARAGTIDSLRVPNNRTRSVFLIDVAAGASRSNVDSLVNVWHNGGATPAFRRIQHLKLWAIEASGGAIQGEAFDLTIYRAGGTCRNKMIVWTYQAPIDLPVDADSLAFTSRTSPFLDLEMAYW